MAAEEGVVIACHTKEEFKNQMTKAKDAGKLVRVPRPCSPIFLPPSRDFRVILGSFETGFIALGLPGSVWVASRGRSP